MINSALVSEGPHGASLSNIAEYKTDLAAAGFSDIQTNDMMENLGTMVPRQLKTPRHRLGWRVIYRDPARRLRSAWPTLPSGAIAQKPKRPIEIANRIASL